MARSFRVGVGALVGCLIVASCTFGDLDGLSSGGPPAPDAATTNDGSVSDARANAGGPNDGGPNDARADADAEAGAASGCPGNAGPAMVRVGSYCVDATEVTAADYALFVAARVGVDTQPVECAFNTSFAPKKEISADMLPARYVNWCDARAYCAWAGKRLCGKIGGGPSLYSNPDLPTEEWFMACSKNNTRSYPYGPSYDGGACNGGFDASVDAPVFVGSKKDCEGGFPGLFDMSGNVNEWTNACNSVLSDGGEECIVRGGTSDDRAEELACGYRHTDPRNYITRHVGIRCCADAL